MRETAALLPSERGNEIVILLKLSPLQCSKLSSSDNSAVLTLPFSVHYCNNGPISIIYSLKHVHLAPQWLKGGVHPGRANVMQVFINTVTD